METHFNENVENWPQYQTVSAAHAFFRPAFFRRDAFLFTCNVMAVIKKCDAIKLKCETKWELLCGCTMTNILFSCVKVCEYAENSSVRKRRSERAINAFLLFQQRWIAEFCLHQSHKINTAIRMRVCAVISFGIRSDKNVILAREKKRLMIMVVLIACDENVK